MLPVRMPRMNMQISTLRPQQFQGSSNAPPVVYGSGMLSAPMIMRVNNTKPGCSSCGK